MAVKAGQKIRIIVDIGVDGVAGYSLKGSIALVTEINTSFIVVDAYNPEGYMFPLMLHYCDFEIA